MPDATGSALQHCESKAIYGDASKSSSFRCSESIRSRSSSTSVSAIEIVSCCDAQLLYERKQFRIISLYAEMQKCFNRYFGRAGFSGFIIVCLVPLSCRSGVDRSMERAPGLVKQFVNALPVFFGDAALLGLRVAYVHRFGSEARVLQQAFGGDAVDFGGERGEGAVHVAGRVARALAVYDAPLEFEVRGALRLAA